MSILYIEAALQRCSYEKAPQKICRKSTGEHPCRSVTSAKPPCSFIEVTLQRGPSPTNPPHKPPKHPPTRAKEHPQGTASGYIQKSKLI